MKVVFVQEQWESFMLNLLHGWIESLLDNMDLETHQGQQKAVSWVAWYEQFLLTDAQGKDKCRVLIIYTEN